MNRIYRSIWNDKAATFVAVSEIVKSGGKKASSGATAVAGCVRFAIRALAGFLMLAFGSNLYALPTGGAVSAGSASIASGAGTMTVSQSSQNAAINWQSFSIGQTEAVRFMQPNSSSVALNRVLGSDPSSILGSLSANGKLFLVNPSGILFGKGASVNVGGLVASTLNISDGDFMAGRYKFAGAGGGTILNQGTINADGGYVALLGANVSNEGTIGAKLGTVALAAGDAITLDMAGDGLLNVAVNQGAVNALVENGGLIQADGGQVLLTARSAGALLDTVINMNGVIKANSLVNMNGIIRLEGGEAGVVSVSGTLDASGTDAGQTGGTVHVLGDKVGLFGGHINASGDAGGGTVLVGGDYQGQNPSVQSATAAYVSKDSSIAADALTAGNGGKAIVWSDNTTRFNGNISARGGAHSGNGGFVEVSGKHYLDFDGQVDTRAPKGQAGTLLLDPDEIHIINAAGGAALAMTCNGGGDCTTPTGTGPYIDFASSATIGELPDHTINQQLALGNVTVQTATGGIFISYVNGTVTFGPTTGGVDVAGGNAASNANTLTLNSATDISWDAAWSYRNLGQLTLNASVGSIAGTGALTLADTSPVLMQAGTSIGSAATPMAISGNGGNVTINAGTSATLGAISAGAGTISATAAGDITISGALTNTDSGTSAVVLKAGDGTAAGTATGGDVIVSGGSISTAGRATLFTGGVSTSTGVGTLVGADHSRYNSSPTWQGYSLALPATGTYAIYREQPTLTITANNPTAITYGDAKPAYTTAVTNLQNGDTAGQALSTAASVADDGVVSTSNHLTATSHTLTPSAAIDQLGYALSYATGTLTITKLDTNVSGTRTYDRTTDANGTDLTTVTTLIAGDTVTVSGTGSVATKDVGTDKAVTNGSLALDNTNYNLLTTGNTLTITAAALGVNAVTDSRGYNGTTSSAGVVTFTGVQAGDSVTGATQAYASKNVLGLNGSILQVNAGYTVNDGNTGSNYTVTENTAAGTITAAALGVNAVTDSRGYNGTTSSTGVVTFTGVQAGDSVTGATQAYASKNVLGLNGSILQVNAGYTVNDGNTGSNYTVTENTAAGTITALAITGNITAANKVYDANDAATILTRTLTGVLGADAVSYSGGAASFDTKNVGTGKTVTGTGLGLTGTDAGNYTVNGTALTTADITARAITGRITAANKVYDANDAATILTRTLTGVLGADVVSYSGGAALFSDKNVAAGKTVTGTGLSLAGADAGNYTVNATAATTADITALAITGNITAANKVYDATDVATISGRTLTGVLGADAVSYSGGAASFDTKNVGTGKTVTGTGLGLTGTDAGNYTVNGTALTTADITARAITGRITAANKVYDANDAATILTRTLTGVLGADVVSYSGGAALFSDKNVAAGKTVTGTGLSLAGADAGNYTVNATAATTADITAKGITGNITAANKVYDANNSATILTRTLTGAIVGDTVSYTGGTAAFDAGQNVGTGLVVNATGLALSGTDAGNYTVNSTATSTANITRKALTVTGISAANKVYDGGTVATLIGGALSGLIGTETITFSGQTSAFADKNVGTGKAVSVSGITLASGTGLASNYSISNPTGLSANITPKALTVSASGTNRVYDGTTTDAVSLADNRVTGDILSLTNTAANFADQNVGAGKAVSVSGIVVTGLDAGNYTFNTTAATTADITLASLTVTANNAAKIQFEPNPAFSATYSGFVNGETPSALAGLLALNTSATNTSPAGDYAIIPSGYSATNYSIAYVDGVLKVIPTSYKDIVATAVRMTSIIPLQGNRVDPEMPHRRGLGGSVSGDPRRLNLTVIGAGIKMPPGVQANEATDSEDWLQ